MIINEKVLNVIAGHFYGVHIENLVPGQKVLITQLEENLAATLAKFCSDYFRKTNKSGITANIGVLSSETNLNSLRFAPQKAIEYRNNEESLILFIPTSKVDLVGSLMGFTTISFKNYLENLIDEYLIMLEDIGISVIKKYHLENLRNLRGNDEIIEFLIDVHNSENPSQTFLNSLHKIGLIPDYSENNLNSESFENNIRVSILLNQSLNPFESVSDRFDSCGVSNGLIRNRIEDLVSESERTGENWLLAISEIKSQELHFANWPFNKASDLQIDSIYIKGFLNTDGNLNRKAKVKIDLSTGEFYSEGEVVIDWETKPKKIVADLKWKIEVLDSVDLNVAQAIQTYNAGNNSRTKKIDLKDEVENDNKRLIVRISAQDSSGATLRLSDGSVASALSNDFFLRLNDTEGEVDTEEKIYTDKNLSLSLIKTLLQDKYLEDLEYIESSKYDMKNQFFETYLGHRSQRIRMSSYVHDAQVRILENPDKTCFFLDDISLGNIRINLDSASIVELDFPEDFKSARSLYLRALKMDAHFCFPEVARWNPNLVEAFEGYLQEYARILSSGDKYSIRNLMLLDTIELSVDSSHGKVKSVLVLPCHPLRSAWLYEYRILMNEIAKGVQDIDFRKRNSALDYKLLSEIEPANYPFLLKRDNEFWLYSGEVSFGAGLYLMLEETDVTLTKNLVLNSIGFSREKRTSESLSTRFADHLESYTKDFDFGPGLKISSFNCGDGKGLADGIELYRKKVSSAEKPEKNYEIVTYANQYSTFEPVGALSELQMKINSTLKGRRQELFNNSMTLRVQDFSDFEKKPESFNISLIQSTTSTSVVLREFKENQPNRKALLNGLITYLHSNVIEENGKLLHFTVPAMKAEDTKLENLHNVFLSSISDDGEIPILSLMVTETNIERLSEIHRRSDWVVTADRFIQLSLYEELLSRNNSNIVILDYSPDFVDGFGDRITLTTTKFTEISRVIGKAMQELGLANQGISAVDVIRDLSKISGRLAMRLLNENSLATEALGLCASMRYMEKKNWLENAIIIPIDAHQDLFGLNRFQPNGTKERCDVLVVRFEDDTYSIQLIEVKTRNGRIVGDLPLWMKIQLDNTELVLNRLLFDENVVRVDRDVQWSRWLSLLHFYADRSFIHGVIAPDKIEEFHAKIERLGETQKSPSISKLGFIVSLIAEAQEDQMIEENYKVIVLNEERLVADGWTTLSESVLRMEKSQLVPFQETVDDFNKPSTHQEVVESVGDKSLASIVEKKLIEPFIAESKILMEEPSSPPKVEITVPVDKIRVVLGHTFSGNDSRNSNEAEVEWKVELQGSPHAVVVGIPGQGKSVTTVNIINQFHESGLPSLVFDFHGEMKDKLNFSANVIDVPKDKLPFSPFDFYKDAGMPIRSAAQEIAESLASIGDLGDIQMANVVLAIRKIYDDLGWTDDGRIGSRLPTVDEFIIALAIVEAQNKGKNASNRLMSFTDYDLFDPENQSAIDFRDKGFVFDVSSYRIDEVKITIGAFILRKLYNDMFTWGSADKPRVAIVLDEAHRLSKDPTIPKLMKEGRKYGVVVVLVSQSLDDFAPQVVENVGLKIVFRTNFPASKKVAQLVRGRSKQDIPKIIETLTTARALVSLPGYPTPMLTHMRK